MSTRSKRTNYERDDATFPADAYSVRQYPGVAFWVRGWETQPDADTEWSGMEERTGRVIATMIGDDAYHSLDPDDVTPIARGQCGQIGCGHDGLDRSDET
jgi:hypothetical protein